MNVRTIIIAGTRDIGSSKSKSLMPAGLWPVFGTPVLERLLTGLAGQGIDDVTVCSNRPDELISSIDQGRCPDLTFLDESKPVGPAGCIKKAVDYRADDLILVLEATLLSLPGIEKLLEEHKKADSDLTVFFCHDERETKKECETRRPVSSDDDLKLHAAGIYVCSASVLEYIPEDGYFDIKESLIPALLAGGKKVSRAVLSNRVNRFRGRQDYMEAILDLVENAEVSGIEKLNGYENVWAGENVEISRQARLRGNIVLLDGARIDKGAIVLGPSVIGRNVHIGQNSIVARAVIWDGVTVSSDRTFSGLLSNSKYKMGGVEFNTKPRTEARSILCRILSRFENNKEKAAGFRMKKQQPALNRRQGAISKDDQAGSKRQMSNIREQTVQSFDNQTMSKGMIAGGLLLSAAFLWSYWPNIMDLWGLWMRSDEFSSGLLVPFLAAYVLWSRRKRFAGLENKPVVIIGGLGFLFAQFVRLAGAYYMYGSLERFSIVLSISALVLMVLGWKFFWKAFSVLLFLFLMLPWPNQVQSAITQPLQGWATNSAVFCLEMIGYNVIREGNIIRLGDTTVAVAEACNGLRMITAFFVIIGLIVLLVERPKWEKLLVLASCLPIALLCNTIRLTVTSIAFTFLEGENWETMFHDFGGYAMMPLALAIAVGELWVLKALTTPPEEVETRQVVAARHVE